jgi:hypothetical protein
MRLHDVRLLPQVELCNTDKTLELDMLFVKKNFGDFQFMSQNQILF